MGDLLGCPRVPNRGYPLKNCLRPLRFAFEIGKTENAKQSRTNQSKTPIVDRCFPRSTCRQWVLCFAWTCSALHWQLINSVYSFVWGPRAGIIFLNPAMSSTARPKLNRNLWIACWIRPHLVAKLRSSLKQLFGEWTQALHSRRCEDSFAEASPCYTKLTPIPHLPPYTPG